MLLTKTHLIDFTINFKSTTDNYYKILAF